MSKGKGLSAETISGASGIDRAPLTAQIRGEPSKAKYSMTFFMPRPTARRMKAIALERNTSLQQLVAEAVDEWLAKRGEPPFEVGT